MEKKDCVIFAVWGPFRHRIQAYIDVIKANWLDCDFYVGINPGTDELFEIKLRELGITNIIHVHPLLVLNSDASAYQAALYLYKHIRTKKYNNIFFMHTKGMSYLEDYRWKVSREDYFDAFANKRAQLEEILKDPSIGGCGLVSQIHPGIYNKSSCYIPTVTKFTPPPLYPCGIDILWCTTHYVMKSEHVDNFVDVCSEDFFKTNLNDRYYFESSFPIIIELYSGKKRESFIYWEDDTKEKYTTAMRDWDNIVNSQTNTISQ